MSSFGMKLLIVWSESSCGFGKPTVSIFNFEEQAKQETNSACHLPFCSFLFDYHFELEDGNNMSLLNFSGLTPDYTSLYPRPAPRCYR